MEVDGQQPLDADDGGDKDWLRDCSLREDYGVRPKRGAPSCFPRLPCDLLGFGDSATCLLDCVLDHFGRRVKRGGKCADQVSGPRFNSTSTPRRS